MHGLSFLTPLATLFVLAAALPLAALMLTERRAGAIRDALDVSAPRRRTLVPVGIALVVLTSLVAAAAAQPVVVRRSLVNERADAQAFFLFDTSRSMQASTGRGQPTRLERAKRMALKLRATLPDVPIGLASMTDRSLPNLMPTTDATLFERALAQSVAVDHPPPSQPYQGRATNFQALIPLVDSHFYGREVQRRLLVVFTDGEAEPLSPILRLTLHRRVAPVFVHVWNPNERIYLPRGRIDPNYRADPGSAASLTELAAVAGADRVLTEQDGKQAARDARDAVGFAGTHQRVDAYARIPLAPWIVLAGVAPLAFLLWRRNA
jgi:VWA domain-containing protein